MGNKRSIRRHHYQRRKERFRKKLLNEWCNYREQVELWGEDWFDAFVAAKANTPKPCSCYMCGNPRRVFSDKLTIQEKRAFQDDGTQRNHERWPGV